MDHGAEHCLASSHLAWAPLIHLNARPVRSAAPRPRPAQAARPGRRRASPPLALATGEQVAIEVEGDLDVRVTHEGRERLRVDARGDHQRGVGVAALVRGDPVEARRLPRLIGPALVAIRPKRVRRRPTEGKLVAGPS